MSTTSKSISTRAGSSIASVSVQRQLVFREIIGAPFCLAQMREAGRGDVLEPRELGRRDPAVAGDDLASWPSRTGSGSWAGCGCALTAFAGELLARSRPSFSKELRNPHEFGPVLRDAISDPLFDFGDETVRLRD